MTSMLTKGQNPKERNICIHGKFFGLHSQKIKIRLNVVQYTYGTVRDKEIFHL